MMAQRERWYFTKDELENSPSRRFGIDAEKELSYRQQAANLIQDMGQKLKVNQLVINTAIVYMHRFYTQHSFTRFHRNSIASCALFLAAKVEEQHRKLEHVIKVAQICLYRENLDPRSEQFQALAAELVHHENLMLRTLGFDLSVQHPHTYVVNCFDLVRANKDLAQASYIMATNSLHLTTMCLQYKPTVVACICVYFVCKWASFELSRSIEGRDWWSYVDPNVTQEMLEELTGEFLSILKKCPSRLKKILSSSRLNPIIPNSPSMKPTEHKRSNENQQHNSISGNRPQQYHPHHHQNSSISSAQKMSPKDPKFSSHANNVRSSKPSIPLSGNYGQSNTTGVDHHQSHHHHHHHHHSHHQHNSEQPIHHHGTKQSQSIVTSKQQQQHSFANSSSKSTAAAKNPALLESSSSLTLEKMKKESLQNDNNNNNNNHHHINSNVPNLKSNLSVISSSSNINNNNNNNNNRLSGSNNLNNNNNNNEVINHSNNNSFNNDPIFQIDSMFSPGSEYSDYSQTKKDSFADFKMEFSDNEDSTNAFNYSLPGLGSSLMMMNDSNEDSKSNISNSLEFSNTINHKSSNNNNISHPTTAMGSNTDLKSSSSLPMFNELASNTNTNHHHNPTPSLSQSSSMSNFLPNKDNESEQLEEKSMPQSTNKSMLNMASKIPIVPTTNQVNTLDSILGSLTSNSNNNNMSNIDSKLLPSQPSIGSNQPSSTAALPQATAAFNQLINDTYHSSQPPLSSTSGINSLLMDDELSKQSSSSFTQKHHHKEKHKHHKDKHKHKEKHHKHKHKKDRHDGHHHHHHQRTSDTSSSSFALIPDDDGDGGRPKPIKLKIRTNVLSSTETDQRPSTIMEQSPTSVAAVPAATAAAAAAAAPLKLKINLKQKNISSSDQQQQQQQQQSNKKRKH
ncbi:Cyclin-T2 [Dermatophagoides farinae]|uniref:Cyclin-T2 n=1 Tax=Dermatophagoides farinae TaxID=6954 RepID=A0A922LCE6_DERFA|nr:Cyclin-T2 [Dermatophagoides farinae]